MHGMDLEPHTQPDPMSAPATTTWSVDASHSLLEFSVKHMMVATVKGRFAAVTGTVHYDGLDLAGASIDVEIPVDSLDTRVTDRDNHLKSPDFFDAANHPTIRFRSTRITPGAGNAFTITGDLTIRGTTREVTLAAESGGTIRDPWGMERAGFSATGAVDRFDYGLHWNAAIEAGGFVVGAAVKIALEVEIVRPAA